MSRMRHTTTAVVFCLFTVLSGAGLLAAAELQDDEKITAPMPTAPGRSGTVILVPTPSPSRTPAPERPGIAPHPPGTSPPDKAAPVELPLIPVLPQMPDGTTELTPPHQQETTPQQETLIVPPAAPPTPEPPAEREPDKQASPMDFLPMPTLLGPEKTQPEAKAKKGKLPGKAQPEDPKTPPPQQAEQAKPKAGDPLRIPPDAAKTGDLSFLEGCWRGNPPEYHSKRIIAVRLCFDKNGSGRMTIEDPRDGQCTGAAKGTLGEEGLLSFTTEKAPCTKGSAYEPTSIRCEGVGNATVCSVGVKGSRQLQRIPFVRE